jgi:hypothetical protein
MNTKLTLRLDDELIRSAKRYAGRSGKSVSRLVADYFALIGAASDPSDVDLTPRVRSLLGALSGPGVDEQDYLRHLEDKHR